MSASMQTNTLYLERSEVRAVLVGVADEHVHIAEHLLREIDRLPILTADDIWKAAGHG